MTPKEKANELTDKFYQTTPNESWYNPPLGSILIQYRAWAEAKQCAYIAVDEILNEFMFDDSEYANRRYKYWEEVKQEIKKL